MTGAARKTSKKAAHVNVGVIGLGIGRNHARGYQNHPMCRLAALCDASEDRLSARAAEFKVDESRCFKTPSELIAAADDLELDAVSVALPNDLHAPVSIEALEAGLHVLCEKPLALTAADGKEMLEAAEKADRKLGVNLSFRFRPQSRALKDIADSGKLGRIYYAHTRWWRERGLPGFGGWFGTKDRSGGGPIIDLGVHRLDLAMWLMGNPEPVAVSAATYDFIGSRLAAEQAKTFDVEDLGTAFVRFANGATLTLEASWAGYCGAREDQVTEVLGERGGIVQRNLREGYDYEARVMSEDGGSLTETLVRRRLDPSPDSYEEFVDAIIEDREPLAPAWQALQVQRVLDGIYESARLGREVRLDEAGE